MRAPRDPTVDTLGGRESAERIRVQRLESDDRALPAADELRYRALFEPFGVPRDRLTPPSEPEAVRFAGFLGDRVVAYGVLIPSRERTAQVRQVCVAEDVRRRGHGAALMAAIEHEAWRAGAVHVWLDARVPYVGFYRSLGYRVTSDTYHVGLTEVPHMRMEKSLGDEDRR